LTEKLIEVVGYIGAIAILFVLYLILTVASGQESASDPLFLPTVLISLFLGFILCSISIHYSRKETFGYSRNSKKETINYLDYHENTDRINRYNKETHTYYIQINESFKKVDSYLKKDPKLKIDDQLRLAELIKFNKICPNCDNNLFLYKKFLLYCPNCEKFISEIKFKKS